MSPPKKKRKTKKPSLKPSPTPESTANPPLPDDLLISCLARVSRLHYQTLSLVSKRFRSLLASPELYQTRSILNRTESCLYLCLRFLRELNFRWFTLCRRPDTKKKTKNASGNLLVSVSSPYSLQGDDCAGVVAFGSSIYSIGGYVDNFSHPSSSVSILDCRSHTWKQAPNMLVGRRCQAVNVIDGKIYVIGGREDYKPSWIEFFDTKTETWNSVSSPGREISGYNEIVHSTVIDGKICMYGGGVAYDPKDGTCEPLEWDMCQGWVCHSHCVIDNVLFYYYEDKVFKWFDAKARMWRDLKGLEGTMPRIAKRTSVHLANYGGKIAILWDKKLRCSGDENKVIWCAVIAVERRDSEDEIWGTVEWFDVVLTVPTAYRFMHLLATTL